MSTCVEEPDLWELNPSHIFILSSSGKPIFSKHGDEQELVTSFGLLQAIYSIIQDAGDTIKSITAGNRKIVYFVRESLFFVSMSSTREPEAVMYKQLEFAYSQILLILTSKVHSVLQNNASKDLRDLLGPDTTRLMKATCTSNVTPENIAFDAIKSLPMGADLRNEIIAYMKLCVEDSNAAAALLLFDDSLLVYMTNESSGLVLTASDIILLSSFVSHSTSLKSNDQSWVPICLPAFNANAYLQAYIANFPLTVMGSKMLSLVLISASTDADMFRNLHTSRTKLQERLSSEELSTKIKHSILDENIVLNRYLKSFLALHFFFKCNPAPTVSVPAQYLSSSFSSAALEEDKDRIWTQYYVHGIRMRCGAATPESCLFGTSVLEHNLVDSLSSSEKAKSRQGSFLASSLQETVIHTVMERGMDGKNIMTLSPSSNHSLVYTCSLNEIIVGLASADSELHVCFPSVMGPLDACNLANNLFFSLKSDINMLLQTSTAI